MIERLRTFFRNLFGDISDEGQKMQTELKKLIDEPVEAPKRKRGRPRKNPVTE